MCPKATHYLQATCSNFQSIPSNSPSVDPQCHSRHNTETRNTHGEFTVIYRNETKAELSAQEGQMAEHLTCKQGLAGLIPCPG